MLTALVLATVCLPSERSADTSIYQFTLAQWLISSLLSACALNASLSPETLLQQVHHSTSSSLLSDCWKAEVTAASCAVGNIKQLFIHYDYCSCYLWNKNGAGRLRFFLLLTQFSQPRRALVQNPHRWLAKVKKTDISVLLGKGVDAQKCQSLLSQHLCDWTNLLSSSYNHKLLQRKRAELNEPWMVLPVFHTCVKFLLSHFSWVILVLFHLIEAAPELMESFVLFKWFVILGAY